MDELNWWKTETWTATGPYGLQNTINQLATNYKTNIVVSKVDKRFQAQDDNYTVEVWYNFKSRCYVLNVFYTRAGEDKLNEQS